MHCQSSFTCFSQKHNSDLFAKHTLKKQRLKVNINGNGRIIMSFFNGGSDKDEQHYFLLHLPLRHNRFETFANLIKTIDGISKS